MMSFKFPFAAGLVLALLCSAVTAQPPAPVFEDIALGPRFTIASDVGTTNVIEYADELATKQWRILMNLRVTNNPYVFVDLSATNSPQRFYRVMIPGVTNVLPDTNAPAGMALIPAGAFAMGDTIGDGGFYEQPAHLVHVSAFYMDRYEVTKVLWDEVKTWAAAHGYTFWVNAGSGKAANHPVQAVNWYDVVKWCNARSEKAGLTPVYCTNAAMTQVFRTDYALFLLSKKHIQQSQLARKQRVKLGFAVWGDPTTKRLVTLTCSQYLPIN
jgi:hypothetical protein